MFTVLVASKVIGAQFARFVLENTSNQVLVLAAPPNPDPVREVIRDFDAPAVELDAVLSSTPRWSKKNSLLLHVSSSVIFSKSFLESFAKRVNFHSSFLPFGRGTRTATRAIIEGTPYGVSIVEMNEDLDSGAVYIQQQIPYTIEMNAQNLLQLGDRMMLEMLFENWKQIQDPAWKAQKTFASAPFPSAQNTDSNRSKHSDEVLRLKDFVLWIQGYHTDETERAVLIYRENTYRLTLTVEPVTAEK